MSDKHFAPGSGSPREAESVGGGAGSIGGALGGVGAGGSDVGGGTGSGPAGGGTGRDPFNLGGSDAEGGLMAVDEHGEPGGSFSSPGGSDPGGSDPGA